MAWTNTPRVNKLVGDLLALRLRAERLALLRKVRVVESQASAAGAPSMPLRVAADGRDTGIFEPVVKPARRVSHIVARPKEGSNF